MWQGVDTSLTCSGRQNPAQEGSSRRVPRKSTRPCRWMWWRLSRWFVVLVCLTRVCCVYIIGQGPFCMLYMDISLRSRHSYLGSCSCCSSIQVEWNKKLNLVELSKESIFITWHVCVCIWKIHVAWLCYPHHYLICPKLWHKPGVSSDRINFVEDWLTMCYFSECQCGVSRRALGLEWDIQHYISWGSCIVNSYGSLSTVQP